MAGDVGSFSFITFVASSKSPDFGVSQYLSASGGSETLSSTTEPQYLYRFGELLIDCCMKVNDLINRAHPSSMFLVKTLLLLGLLFGNWIEVHAREEKQQ